MTQIWAIGAQALAPKRGNICNQENGAPAIDNSIIAKAKELPLRDSGHQSNLGLYEMFIIICNLMW